MYTVASIVLYLVLVLQTKDSRTSNKDLINVEENILMGFRNTYCSYCWKSFETIIAIKEYNWCLLGPVFTSFQTNCSSSLPAFPIPHSFTRMPSLLSPQTTLLSLCHSFVWSLCFSSFRFEHFQAALFEQKKFFCMFRVTETFSRGNHRLLGPQTTKNKDVRSQE